MHSLGFCIGFISIIQPSNHMDFEVAKSFTIGISIIVGAIGLWLVFKLYPQSSYTISRKIAIKSIIKDIQKLKKRQISKEHYQAGLIKKILSVYKNRKDDAASERYRICPTKSDANYLRSKDIVYVYLSKLSLPIIKWICYF